MFSAFKKLARGDDRCTAPIPMSTSLQKKFSKGVHFNMKILIKGDRNVGKSCLLQRLQGGTFLEEYAPTEQIQVAPINWGYKNSDHIVKVEVWEVVDKGKTKKKTSLGLKLENQSMPEANNGYETPVLDATFLDVYKNANGVILMFDITKPWTFEYVVKEISGVPADLPVVILGNHCDMQHHRQVHTHHIECELQQVKLMRTAPMRYAESSMRNGFGLRFLHKFFSVPFLRLQKTSLLEQLARNRKDIEEIEKELDDYQKSEEAHYNTFVDRLTNKRRESTAQLESRTNNERMPSIVLGAGKPIVPPDVNPLLAQSLLPTSVKAAHSVSSSQPSEPLSPEISNASNKYNVSMDVTPAKPGMEPECKPKSVPNIELETTSGASGSLDEFYAGALDSSFLDDLPPLTSVSVQLESNTYDEDSDEDKTNPRVNVDQDDLDIDSSISRESQIIESKTNEEFTSSSADVDVVSKFDKHIQLNEVDNVKQLDTCTLDARYDIQLIKENEFPLWAGDTSARRSPEGDEDPDAEKERADQKVEKKHKKKKSKEKDRGDCAEKSERKEKKHKHKKSKSERSAHSVQQDLLLPTTTTEFNYEEYDSL